MLLQGGQLLLITASWPLRRLEDLFVYMTFPGLLSIWITLDVSATGQRNTCVHGLKFEKAAPLHRCLPN